MFKQLLCPTLPTTTRIRAQTAPQSSSPLFVSLTDVYAARMSAFVASFGAASPADVRGAATAPRAVRQATSSAPVPAKSIGSEASAGFRVMAGVAGLASVAAASARKSKRSLRRPTARLAANADASSCVKLAVYGKGGIGKSTTSCNISVALARRGKKVLQIGCDPKHDSTFTLTGFLIPTIIDTLQEKDYHYENVWPEDVIYKGYGGVDCVEAGGPPAGAGCGGYVVGETVKLLKELNAFYEYDVILFDVLGDVVCGGFAAPLNYADYCMIVTDNGFDALFAANRIGASVREKARTHPLRLAGLIGNRTSKRDLIDKYVQNCPMPVLEVLPLIEDIRVSRVKGKTLFELAEKEPSLKYVCDYYLNIADQLLAAPEGVVPKEVPDRELF
ncbi:unnamed protein product, partial [Polarella glacialis]